MQRRKEWAEIVYKIFEINNDYRKKVVDFIKNSWGSDVIVSRGKAHFVEHLDGFIVVENEKIIGMATYMIEDQQLEVISLDSFKEGKGIGTALIEKIMEVAKKKVCHRVWLITTNDNTQAMRFYQKRGFHMAALHRNAVTESRRIKPEIPLYGFDNIPILDEVEFEKRI